MTTSGKPQKYKAGEHPNSRANLKSGYHGQNMNPNGYSLSARLKKLLSEKAEFISPTARPEDKLWGDQIVRTILAESATGNVPMIKELLDRTEGKVPGDIPASFQDNRVVNIYVDSEKAKELTQGVSKFGIFNRGEDDKSRERNAEG